MRDLEYVNLQRQSRIEITRAGGRENGEIVFNGYRVVSGWDDEKVVEMNSADGCTTL